MLVAAAGALPPIAGATAQEIIDVLAVLNALRASIPPRVLTDSEPKGEARHSPPALAGARTDRPHCNRATRSRPDRVRDLAVRVPG